MHDGQNVINMAEWSAKKASERAGKILSPAELELRIQNIRSSIVRINALMKELRGMPK